MVLAQNWIPRASIAREPLYIHVSMNATYGSFTDA
jgi:hypothetical protein